MLGGGAERGCNKTNLVKSICRLYVNLMYNSGVGRVLRIFRIKGFAPWNWSTEHVKAIYHVSLVEEFFDARLQATRRLYVPPATADASAAKSYFLFIGCLIYPDFVDWIRGDCDGVHSFFFY